jgi:hypothetical protein
MDQDALVNQRVHALAHVHRCSIEDVHKALIDILSSLIATRI